MRLLFLDIETTGFDRRWDSIIEIAAVLYNTDLKKEICVFHEYIKPTRAIPPHITELTGITNQMVKNCREEKEVIEDFITFIHSQEPDALVGHNYDAFDGNFFKHKASFYFLQWPDYDTIDTLKLARKMQAPTSMRTPKGAPSYKQESLAGAFNFEYNAHSAIEDVRTLIKIYLKLTEKPDMAQKRSLLGF